MESVIGVNAWFEPRSSTQGAPGFKAARVQPNTAYRLCVDIATVPYGGSNDQIGTWLPGGLGFALTNWGESDKSHTLLVEIRPGPGFVVEGSNSLQTCVTHNRIQEALAHPDASLGFEAWDRAQNIPDYSPDALKKLQVDADVPFVIARVSFDVRTTMAETGWWLGIVLSGDDPVAAEFDSSEILVSRSDPPYVMIPWGAGPPFATAPEPDYDWASAAPGPARDRVVIVFYATDRKNTGAAEPRERYSGEQGDLELGVLKVSIPPGHEEGEIERPWLRWLESTDKHVVLVAVETLDGPVFFPLMAEAIGHTDRKEAFVFIHGYNVTFEGAALRTGQIAYDLKRLGVDAVPILYSWPSLGEASGYGADYDTAEWTAKHLAGFLNEVRAKSGAEVIHLIAHSMGNRALTQALARLTLTAPGEILFNEVILAAPDIDAEVFRQLAEQIRGSVQRMTLYANSRDKALQGSEKLRRGRPRAGDIEDGIAVIVSGVETIDASNLNTGFLGHSYFAANETVIKDVCRILDDGAAPGARPWLETRGSASRRWWAFSGD